MEIRKHPYWNGKNILISGASSGIGEALAVAIASRGARVGLIARRRAELERISRDIASLGGAAAVFECDVSDEHSVQSAVGRFLETFGTPDIVIANAGIGGKAKLVEETAPADIKTVLDINLMGTVNLVSSVIGPMVAAGQGQIVGVSSLAGFRGLPRSGAYSASKAAMTAFLESLRLEVASKGISVTIIQPGFIKTPLTSGRKNKMPFLMELEDSIPLFLRAIEKRKRFSAFPWQLATIVRLGKMMPAALYDWIASGLKYRQ